MTNIDSIAFDSTRVDSLPVNNKNNKSSKELEARVEYSANDSMEVDLQNNIIFLFGAAKIKYMEINLEADYIKYDLRNKEVYATGIEDSSGNLVGTPVFKDESGVFDSKSMRYNFGTKKAYILKMMTPQEGGFLHGDTIKMESSGNVNIKNGKYTTCDLEHPHFYIAMTKAKVIPKDKIISGPAYIVVEDIPLPIGLPFGFFPNTAESASGIIIPTYGEEKLRGFFLKNGGYYFAINDFVDLRLTGDIYSKGTWGTRIASQYRKRYRYNGSFSGRYYVNKLVTDELNPPNPSKDFAINWVHNQDPKANPDFRFNAKVDFSTSSFDQLHSESINKQLTNTKSSSISFQKSWPNSPFSMDGSFYQTQNSITKDLTMSLPKLSFNMTRIYPFRNKERVGKKKWYEDISIKYNANLENKISAKDTAFLETFEMQNGFKHSIPVSIIVKSKKLHSVNISPSLSYTGMLYPKFINYHDTVDYNDYNGTSLLLQETNSFRYAHAVMPGISMTVNPKVYGFYSFKNENIRMQAIRHVMTPTATFSLSPDMSKWFADNYYSQYYDYSDSLSHTYSIFQGYMYGAPSARGKSANLSLSLKNNIEMKLKTINDTVEDIKKVKLLENFDFRTYYDAINDVWSPLTLTGGTRLFNKITLRFGSTWNGYALDNNGIQTNELVWKDWNIGRRVKSNLTIGMSFKSAAGKKKDKEGKEVENSYDPYYSEYIMDYFGYSNALYNGYYVDFNVPWNVKINYSYNYSKPTVLAKTTQSLRLGGDLSLTKNWKIGFNTGYDLESKEFTMTNMNIYRDLHCWEMKLSLVPFGTRQSFTFKINAKSAILQDLKFDKKKSWYDNF